MKTESTVKYVLRLTVTLLLITGIMAAVLAGVNSITAPKIAAITAEKTTQAIAAVLPDAETAVAVDFTDDTGIVTTVYESDSGYAITVTPSGFDGTIEMMVGVNKADGTVTGISIINQSETAGLGAVCAASSAKGENFRTQYIGMSGELAVAKDGGAVEAITGATITSRAVTTGVNAALACAANFG